MISRITFCSAQPAMMRAALWPDPGDLTQAIGLLLDDVEHGFPEGAHELLRINRPNATNHAGAEIFLDPLDCRRCRSLEERGAKLDAMRAVIGPRPARLDELACRDHRRMADEGDEIALAAGFDPQHAKAVLGVVERDPIDQPSQDFGRRACSWCFRHQVMMENTALGRYRDQATDGTWRSRPYQLYLGGQ